MKKKVLIFLLGLSIPISMIGKETGSDEFIKMQEFYYNQGYKDASKKFYQIGWLDHEKNTLKILKKYEAKFEAIEATKYLLSKGYITYPESYRTIDQRGNYRLVIEEPKIEKPLRVEDIFRIPELEGSSFSGGLNSNKLLWNNSDESDVSSNPNGLNLPSIPKNMEIPTSVNSLALETSLSLAKTAKTMDVISRLNLRHLEGTDEYKIYFKNNTEKSNFCYQISGDSTCENMN